MTRFVTASGSWTTMRPSNRLRSCSTNRFPVLILPTAPPRRFSRQGQSRIGQPGNGERRLFPDHPVPFQPTASWIITGWWKTWTDWTRMSSSENCRKNSAWKSRWCSAPANPHEFGLYLQKQWYKLVAHPGSFSTDPIGILDVSILQDNLLDPILGIKDQRTDKRIDFVGGIRGLEELEKRVNGGDMALPSASTPWYPATLWRGRQRQRHATKAPGSNPSCATACWHTWSININTTYLGRQINASFLSLPGMRIHPVCFTAVHLLPRLCATAGSSPAARNSPVVHAPGRLRQRHPGTAALHFPWNQNTEYSKDLALSYFFKKRQCPGTGNHQTRTRQEWCRWSILPDRRVYL